MLGFHTWRKNAESTQIQGLMSDQLKEFMISRLERYANKFKNKKLRDALKAFQENRRIALIKKKVILKFMKSRTGQLYRAWEMWKNLPSKRQLLKKRSVTDIELFMYKFTQSRLKYGWDKIKELWYQMRDIKRKYIRQMLYISQDKKKRMFSSWANTSRNLKYVSLCKATMSVFEILSSAEKNNTYLLFSNDKASEKKIDFIR